MRAIDADLLEPDAGFDDGEFWAYSKAQVGNAPTIAPERKRGRWQTAKEDERNQIVWVECSECGQSLSWEPNYCPNCGAEMKGE